MSDDPISLHQLSQVHVFWYPMNIPIMTHSISSKTDQETWVLISLNTKYSIFAASVITYTNNRATYYSFLDTVTLIVQFWNFPFWKATSLKARDSPCFSAVEHERHETAIKLGNTFSSVVFSYWNNASERCLDLSRINFSAFHHWTGRENS